MIVEHASKPQIQVVDKLEPTERSSHGFGSTEKTKDSTNLPFPIPPTTIPEFSPEPPIAAAAATTELINDPKFIRGIQLEMNIPYKFHLSTSPFDNHTHRLVACKGSNPTLGFIFEMCSKQSRPKLIDVQKSTPAARLPRWRSELRNAYVTSVNDTQVTTIQDITTIIADARQKGDLDISFGFSTIGKQSTHAQTGLPQIYHDQMNVIAEHLWSLKNDPEWTERVLGYLPIAEKIMANTALDNEIDGNDAPLDGIHATVKSIHSNPTISADIKSLKNIKSLKSKKSIKQKNKLTRRILQKTDDWEKWKQSEWKQLDQYRDQSTFGEPEPRKADANLLTLLWTYLIKDDGRLKARCVCNGSKRMTGSVTLAETYASSLDQHGARIFWAATAINNFITIGADAANAFAEAPAPVAPLYVYCDEQYREWYRDRYPERPPIPPGHVMRVQGALQGHPESARLWAILIDKVIRKLNLKPCTHEPNLYYSSDYNNTGKRVLFLRQVDDFAISCEDAATAEHVISAINESMTIEVKKLGLVTRYNGVDVMQTRQYIKIYNATYIEKLIINHPWLKRDEYASAEFPLPMNPDSSYQRSLEQATPLSPVEKDALEENLGFSYRQAIGEILYAVTTCRPDISFAAIKLSQYSTTPARIHYEAVMQVIKYLRDTKDEGIYYWREQPRMDLPIGPIPECKRDDYDESVATREEQTSNFLIGAKDSDFASDSKHRRSVTGVVLKLAGGAVLYKTKFQTVTAQSSTEAEFMAAADAGKHILYLRTLLDEIGIEQIHATVLYEDNQGALLMANAQKPTKRTKHMDIKAFAIQEWIEKDLLTIRRICTSDNYSDGLTKALGRTLFYRHNNYVMGRVIPIYAKQYVTKTIRSLHNDIRIEDISDQNSEFITTFYESNFRSREAARKSLDEANQSLVRIGKDLGNLKKEAERKVKNFTNEIKRLEGKIKSAKDNVNSWRSTVDWHTKEIERNEDRIKGRERDIKNLGKWKKWKRPGYEADILRYKTTNEGLKQSRRGLENSLSAAQSVLTGLENSLNNSRRSLDQARNWMDDPTTKELLRQKTGAENAIEVAKKILEGTQTVIEWAPVDLDPSVAPFIVLRNAANEALAKAHEAGRRLGNVVEDFDPSLHPKVIFHDGTISAQQILINGAIDFLDNAHTTVSGPISDALKFIADGVNLILDAIPLVIKGVYFKSTLSTASNSGVTLHVDYEFLNEDYSLEFDFNFSVRDTSAIIEDFCKEVSSKILDLADDNSRIAVDDRFTFEELMNAKNMVYEFQEELDKESDQMQLDFEFEQTKLKRRLFRSEEAMIDLRTQIQQDQEFMIEEDKLVQSNIATIISGENMTRDLQVASDDDTSEYANAVASIRKLLEDIEGKGNQVQEQLDKFTKKIEDAREEMLREEREEEAEFARVSSSGGNEEERRQKSNQAKRTVIRRFRRHERKLREIIREDRRVKRSIIGARRALYDQTLTHMSTLNSMSDYFLNRIAKAARKRTKRRFNASAQGVRIESTVEMDECETMLLNMSMYHDNLTIANRSIQNRANHDAQFMDISIMQDNMLSTLNWMRKMNRSFVES